jgi:predicted GNAT family N-acyltransferase
MTAGARVVVHEPAPAFEVRIARTQEELRAIIAIRARVFRDEQHIVDDELSDPDDRTAVHSYVVMNDQMIAVARLAPPTGTRAEGQIAWVATLPEFRRRGAAEAAVRALLTVADENGIPSVTLSAQTYAMGLYRRLGFVPFGYRFNVRGIEHQHMERRLPKARSSVA